MQGEGAAKQYGEPLEHFVRLVASLEKQADAARFLSLDGGTFHALLLKCTTFYQFLMAI